MEMVKDVKSRKQKDVPATAGMLHEFRSEMMSRFISMDHKFDKLLTEMTDMKSGFSSMRGEMSSLRSEFKSDISSLRDELKTDMSSLRSELKSDIQKTHAEVHRVGLLVEHQKSENKFALEGYTALYERVMSLEKRKG